MGTSHVIIQNAPLELAIDVDENPLDESLRFTMTVGTGFSTKKQPSINVEMEITLQQLVQMSQRMNEIVNTYKTP